MAIINLHLKLAVGGAVVWKSYFLSTGFGITGLNLYLIALTILVILWERLYV